MQKLELKKKDGRNLTLYSRRPIDSSIQATSANGEPVHANPHLRWHPLRGEWVAYASYRQNRVFLPPREYNPLATTRSAEFPTELPAGDYDVAVFENLSPSLSRHAHSPPPPPNELVPTHAGLGACEVVVFSQDPDTSLGRLPLSQIELLFEVWGDRTKVIGDRPEVNYVMPFENRGVEVGVTLHHPHGQLYAYHAVPPVPARELSEQLTYWQRHGRGLVEDFVAAELADGRRVLYADDLATAFVPACARYTYEVWIAPKRSVALLSDLDGDTRRSLARALKTVLMKYDGLWKKPFPYLMVFHQAPTDGKAHPEAHLHLEFYPPLRTETRLKYLAGTELGSGMFANDSIPEEKAEELKAVEVSID